MPQDQKQNQLPSFEAGVTKATLNMLDWANARELKETLHDLLINYVQCDDNDAHMNRLAIIDYEIIRNFLSELEGLQETHNVIQ